MAAAHGEQVFLRDGGRGVHGQECGDLVTKRRAGGEGVMVTATGEVVAGCQHGLRKPALEPRFWSVIGSYAFVFQVLSFELRRSKLEGCGFPS